MPDPLLLLTILIVVCLLIVFGYGSWSYRQFTKGSRPRWEEPLDLDDTHPIPPPPRFLLRDRQSAMDAAQAADRDAWGVTTIFERDRHGE